MKYNRGLLIPIYILEKASGISKKVIVKDIENSLLRESVKGYVWYHTALHYVFQKWNEGNVEMHPPYSNDPDHSFAAIVLSLMDDEITANNLKVEWKDQI